MNRRGFIKSGLAMSALALGCTRQGHRDYRAVIPRSEPPDNVFAVDMSGCTNWHERNLYSCLQGLVNREKAAVYLNRTPQDQFWLEYYSREFGVRLEHIHNFHDLPARFMSEVDGCIIYDGSEPHSLNIATMLGSLHNALPVEKNLAPKLFSLGYREIDNLSGRFGDTYKAYEWAIDNLLPQCHKKLVAQLCVHHPHWPTSTFTNRDYVIANRIFCFDLSTSERDKRDYELVKEIYRHYEPGALVVGWHCVRDKEHEAIALSAEFGHYGLCSLNTPNLTVHSSIRLEPGTTFKQRRPHPPELKDIVYVAFMATDGDAAWFMLDHKFKDWASPAHGTFKYNWGFLPLAYDLMPGTVKYYMENASDKDFFAAGPAGATYTYPHLHPDPSQFLKLSADYMEKCGLTTVHVCNWNDRDWWQEVNLPEMPGLLRKYLPKAAGFFRGMGESAFEPHYLDENQPYVFCGEGIHRGDDVYRVMKDFIDACPNRPLFIYSLVNHSIPMHEIKEAMDRFPQEQVEIVHLDELLLLIKEAKKLGRIGNDLYPDKSGVRKILAREAKAAWPRFFAELTEMKGALDSGQLDYAAWLKNTPVGLEPYNAAEVLSFQTIWHGMTLVKLALESKGIYVNHKPTATRRFMQEYGSLAEAAVVEKLQETWDNWHALSPMFSEASRDFTRLFQVAEQLNELVLL